MVNSSKCSLISSSSEVGGSFLASDFSVLTTNTLHGACVTQYKVFDPMIASRTLPWPLDPMNRQSTLYFSQASIIESPILFESHRTKRYFLLFSFTPRSSWVYGGVHAHQHGHLGVGKQVLVIITSIHSSSPRTLR
eukprot:TRINITY_DN1334_c0_g1_i1.p1 TRINITY_DN1334_c0_g1~~TRINITY_DN1334_c0_g1_i1.p1  ORF type:complete len:136 (+),score=3.70 TRINITY_DN1334_c0_g1_i1:138-545(+)